VAEGDVAVGSQVSAFVGLVAAPLPSGGRVLAAEGEFTSLVFPFLAREDPVAAHAAPAAPLRPPFAGASAPAALRQRIHRTVPYRDSARCAGIRVVAAGNSSHGLARRDHWIEALTDAFGASDDTQSKPVLPAATGIGSLNESHRPPTTSQPVREFELRPRG
jgi:hypothetical protein